MEKEIKNYLKYLGLFVMIGLSLLIIHICLTSDNDIAKLNECLKSNDLEYCNKEVK